MSINASEAAKFCGWLKIEPKKEVYNSSVDSYIDKKYNTEERILLNQKI
jgi:hypothetical protein